MAPVMSWADYYVVVLTFQLIIAMLRLWTFMLWKLHLHGLK